MSVEAQRQPMVEEPVGTWSTTDTGSPERCAHLLKLAVVALVLAPSASLGRDDGAGLELTVIVTILHDTGLVALLALLRWRNAEPSSDLGWRPRRVVREVAIGLLAFPVVFLFAAWFDSVLQRMGVPGPADAATFQRAEATAGQLLTAVVLLGVVAAVQQSVYGDRLPLRFGQVMAITAVAASSLMFALGHGYAGLSSAISAGVFGALMAALYRWRARLIAPVVVHFLQDLTAIAVLAALHH